MVRDWFTRRYANHLPFSELVREAPDMSVEEAEEACRQSGLSDFAELDPSMAPVALRLIYTDEAEAPQSMWTSFFDDGIVVFAFPSAADAVKFRLLLGPQ